MLRAPTIILLKFSALIILNLEIQLLSNLDPPKLETLHKCFNEIFFPRINLLRLLSFLTRTDEIATLSTP